MFLVKYRTERQLSGPRYYGGIIYGSLLSWTETAVHLGSTTPGKATFQKTVILLFSD